MALQVWLPLTKDLSNQGVGDVTITNHGAVLNSAGKLGSCYDFTGNVYVSGTYKATNSISFACWIYFNAAPSGQHIVDARRKSDGNGYQPMYITASSIQLGSTASGYPSYSYSWQTGKWYHVVCIHDQEGNRFYVDGELIGSSTNYKGSDYGDCEFYLATRYNQANYANVKLNDFRIYDHGLSTKEIKELAKGLVLHYPLSDQYNSSNLIYNGFGEHGSDGWESTTVSTTDLPTGDSTIKATFTGGISKDYVLVNPNNTFSVSAYLKTSGATSGTTYPSIYPCDIDKKFIDYYKCADGFSNTWKTTLSQPLNTGDTVIHATNISNWSTDDNYYYHVAIFGYKDSTGFVYPDMEYTQDAPAFGTKTNKSNLNKANNTITLNSPFTGSPRPAGTVICQSTEGSTYYYPFGGINIANIQSWTKFTNNIDFKANGRLRYCKYIRWSNYSGAKYAGIKITDTTWGSNVVYDTSGFGNNGTANNSPIISSDAPRYNMSLVLDGVNQSVQMPNLSTLVPDGIFTANIWFKKVTDGWGSKAYETIFGGPSGFELEGKNSSTNSPVIRAYNWGGATFEYTLDVWHMLTMVRTTSDTKFYLDGELKLTGSAGSIPSGNYFLGAWSSTTGQNYKGWLSDFRLYETALTADQVKQLYEAPISLADNGTLFANEFNET